MLAMIGLTFVVTEMGGDKKDANSNPETNENDKNHERREKAKQR